MARTICAAFVLALSAVWCGTACADLCPKCQRLMFSSSAGTCSACGGRTSSSALKLCGKCSAAQHKCEFCLAKLDGTSPPADRPPASAAPVPPEAVEGPALEKPSADKPPAGVPPLGGVSRLKPELQPVEKPRAGATPLENLPEVEPPAKPSSEVPGTPPPINPNKPGMYSSGKWQYRLDITEPGTRSEGRWGWLWHDGQKLPRGEVNDFYLTPWGPIYWVDVPKTRWGLHGWMPSPLAQSTRRGRPLTAPAAAAKPAEKAPAQTPPSQPFELTKAHNNQRFRVPVGKMLVVRLPGNPTTGYQWQAAAMQSAAVRLVEKPQYIAKPAAPGMVGSGGVFLFKFQAAQPGTATIRLAYVRPWEKNKPPVDTFTTAIDVVPAAETPAAKPATIVPPPGRRQP